MNRLGMGRFVGLPIAVACLGCGFFLATLHPLQPLFVSGVFLVVLPLFTMRPWFGLLCLPAGLPLLNFSPWTGWLIVDESDLLVLAVAAAGYWRWWWAGRTVVQTYPSPRRNPGTSALNFLDSGLRRNDDSVLRRPDGVALLLGLVALFAGRAAQVDSARRPGGSRDPEGCLTSRSWIPACAGMTTPPRRPGGSRDPVGCCTSRPGFRLAPE